MKRNQFTQTEITYDKKGNIKTIKTPHDNDSIINEPIFAVKEYNHNTLSNLFKGFGEAYLMDFNN